MNPYQGNITPYRGNTNPFRAYQLPSPEELRRANQPDPFQQQHPRSHEIFSFNQQPFQQRPVHLQPVQQQPVQQPVQQQFPRINQLLPFHQPPPRGNENDPFKQQPPRGNEIVRFQQQQPSRGNELIVRSAAYPPEIPRSLTFRHAEQLGPTNWGRYTDDQYLKYHHNKLTWDGVPTLKDLLAPRAIKPFSHLPVYGVIKIENGPYSATRNEVLSVLTKDVLLAQYPKPSANYGVYFPIDIQNQRATGTIYVEVQDDYEARRQVQVFDSFRHHGRRRRLGNRDVRLTVVDQGQLMKDIFSRASCVQWDTEGRPVIYPPSALYLEGFKGFLHSEDMMTLANIASGNNKYARTQIARDYPQRPYEALLAMLRKYPTHAWEICPLKECNDLYDFAARMAFTLQDQLGPMGYNPQWAHVIHRGLLNEIVAAVNEFHGFSNAAKRQFAANFAGPLHPIGPMRAPLLLQ